jgi:hypothetical protein
MTDDDAVRLALVGCGKAKREVTGNPNHANNQYRAAALYASVYFRLKREYAERMCDYWRILSAKHGLYHPFCIMRPYDVQLTPSGFEGDDEPLFESVDAWAEAVLGDVDEMLRYCERGNDTVDEIVVLAGRAYADPLRDRLAELDADVHYPFDATSGIGEQMGWLKAHTDSEASVSVRYETLFDADGRLKEGRA